MQYGDKEIVCVPARGQIGLKLAFTNGGEIPTPLSGIYTSHDEAEMAVLSYLASVNGKVGKGGSKSK